jgi:hypothetical protein
MDITMLNTAITGLLGTGGVAAVAVVVKPIVSLLKNKAKKAQFDHWMEVAKEAVAAAKQDATLIENSDMAKFVTDTLKSVGVPDNLLKTLHEGEVSALKKAANTIETVQKLGDVLLEGGNGDAVAEETETPSIDATKTSTATAVSTDSITTILKTRAAALGVTLTDTMSDADILAAVTAAEKLKEAQDIAGNLSIDTTGLTVEQISEKISESIKEKV